METVNIERGSKSEMEHKAAREVARRLGEAADRRGHAILAVPGGRSVAGVFAALQEQDVPWEKVHLFLVDERFVPADSEQSNFKLARDKLIRPLQDTAGFDIANAHPLEPDRNKPEDSVRRYETIFSTLHKDTTGDGRPAGFDVAILGVGEDGHIASLFPGHPALQDRHPGFLTVDGAPKPPPLRMSASGTLISNSAFTLLLFFGEAKREALATFLQPGTRVQQCPALFAVSAAECLVVTDLTS